MAWKWPAFMPAFAVRLTLLVVYLACAVAVGVFARWWAGIPVGLLAAYQGFWVVMLLKRRSQRRLPTGE